MFVHIDLVVLGVIMIHRVFYDTYRLELQFIEWGGERERGGIGGD